MKIVIALGGNMISDSSNSQESFDDQTRRIATSAGILADIFELGYDMIITHGNGPQVGSLLLQQQANVDGSVELPLHILGALTQGQIGVSLQHALLNELHNRGISKQVVVVPTTVIVSENDPGFDDPSKPVGPYFDEERLAKFRHDDPDFSYVKTDKGYRRIVPSPLPHKILESNTIQQLSKDNLVIAVGGGGTPTVETNNGLEMRDAVIDKDLASAVLANKLGADILLILTNVEGVYQNFNKENEEFLPKLTKNEAEDLIREEEVSKGSMEPKIRAGVIFEGERSIITSPELAIDALEGNAGTTIISN